jgi:outer membrane protein OmpA-like peptidoglycan-associated protein
VFLVNFGFDRAAFTGEVTSVIAEAAEYLTSHRDDRVEVTGHTDLRGSDRNKLNLSMRRAQAVADALIARGVARERIKFGARGLREPLSGEMDEQARTADRRVHITPVR